MRGKTWKIESQCGTNNSIVCLLMTYYSTNCTILLGYKTVMNHNYSGFPAYPPESHDCNSKQVTLLGPNAPCDLNTWQKVNRDYPHY